MVELIDMCVGCTDMGLHCRGLACPYHDPVYVFYCDECGAEMKNFDDLEGRHICDNCLEKEEGEK